MNLQGQQVILEHKDKILQERSQKLLFIYRDIDTKIKHAKIRVLGRVKGLHMKTKILKFSMLIVALVMAFTAYVSYETYKSIQDSNYEGMLITSDVNIESLKQTTELIRGTAFALSGSSAIESWRSDNSFFLGDNKESSLNRESLSGEMQRILVNNNVWNLDLFDYIAIYENDTLLASSYTKPISLNQIGISSRKIYNIIKDRSEYVLFIPPTENDPVLYTSLRIKTDFKNDDCLYIIGASGEDVLKSKLSSFADYKGAACYIADNEGTIYAKAGESDLSDLTLGKIARLKNGKGHREIRVDNTPYELIKKPILADLNFVYVLPKAEVVKSTLSGMKTFLFITALFAAALFIIFIFMINEVKGLLKTTYEAKLLHDEMEIKFLQHQMNPHFLFNILLTIQIKAKMSGDETLYKMISSLSALLRAGLYKDERGMISIAEELKYVEYYLWLQKQRYEERLTYSIDVNEEDIKACEIPRLVIEPMVENAIVHGAENLENEVRVEVNLLSAGDDLIIHVKDNGVGFDPEKIKKPGENEGRREKMGLSNTDQRLKLLYGERYGLNITSKEGEGTDIMITIPKKSFS